MKYVKFLPGFICSGYCIKIDIPEKGARVWHITSVENNPIPLSE